MYNKSKYPHGSERTNQYPHSKLYTRFILSTKFKIIPDCMSFRYILNSYCINMSWIEKKFDELITFGEISM